MASRDKGEDHGNVERGILQEMAADVGEGPVKAQCITAEGGKCDAKNEKDHEASRAYLKKLLVIEPESFNKIQTLLPPYPESGEPTRCIVLILL